MEHAIASKCLTIQKCEGRENGQSYKASGAWNTSKLMWLSWNSLRFTSIWCNYAKVAL